VDSRLSAIQILGMCFWAEARCWRPRLADCPTVGCGPSARRPRVTSEVAGGGCSNGFECGLFLWIPKDIKNLFWLEDLTCMESTKIYVINGEMP